MNKHIIFIVNFIPRSVEVQFHVTMKKVHIMTPSCARRVACPGEGEGHGQSQCQCNKGLPTHLDYPEYTYYILKWKKCMFEIIVGGSLRRNDQSPCSGCHKRLQCYRFRLRRNRSWENTHNGRQLFGTGHNGPGSEWHISSCSRTSTERWVYGKLITVVPKGIQY